MNPDLEKPLEEIKAVLAKYDVAGVVVVANTTHTDFVMEVTPTWTCASMEGDILRIKALRKDFASQEAQNKVVAHTAGMFLGMLEAMETMKNSIMNVVGMLSKSVSLDHTSHAEDGRPIKIVTDDNQKGENGKKA